MSTMFSGAGASTAASVGSGAAAPAAATGTQTPPQGTQPAAVTAPEQTRNADGTQTAPTGDPFLREKLKVDGKEVEVVFQTKEELLAEVQKARGANRRFEESAKLRREAETVRAQAMKAQAEADELREKYGDNTLQAGIDAAIASGDPKRIQAARQVMEEKLAALIRRDMMDPKERELTEREERIRAKEQEHEQLAKTQEQKDLDAKTDGFRKEFTETIIGALESGQVPNTDWSAAIMANLMRHNMKKGLKLNPEVLAGKTKAVIMGQVTGLLGKATGEQLIDWFPDLVKKVRTADLARIRSRQPNQPRKTVETLRPNDSNPTPNNRYMSPDQWREWTKKRAADSAAGRPLTD